MTTEERPTTDEAPAPDRAPTTDQAPAADAAAPAPDEAPAEWSAAQVAPDPEADGTRGRRTRTARSLWWLRIQLTVLFAVMTALALFALDVVVLNIDEQLRWTEMGETLLARAQAASAAVTVSAEGTPDAARFASTGDLATGWPPSWVFAVDGTTAWRLAGPAEGWESLDTDLGAFALRVANDKVDYSDWVHTNEDGTELFARGVPVLDPVAGTPRAVAFAIVGRQDFFADHERLQSSVIAAAVLLALLAAGAGYWLAGRGTRATAAAIAQQERLLSDAAHELRTPVARIRAVTESGLAGDEPPQAALERVQRLSADASRMVDDMLVLARMDAGREDLRREPFRLDLLAEAVASEFPGVRVEAVETVVDGDPGLVRRAVTNLVRNAVVHGGGEVKVTVYPTRIIVSDRGPGIDEAVAPHLFERFHTGPASQGHGLGLAIVRWIADAHGGDVTLANREGGGAEAVLDLEKHGASTPWRRPAG